MRAGRKKQTKDDGGDIGMPTISMFYGIIIYMFYFDNKEHHTPHIHANYAEYDAVISIPEGDVLKGEMPNHKLKLIKAWIEIHKCRLNNYSSVSPLTEKETRCLRILSAKCPVFSGLLQIDYVKLFFLRSLTASISFFCPC